MKTYPNSRKWGAFLVLLLSLSCSSSNPLIQPFVAGTWTVQATNSGLAHNHFCHAYSNGIFVLRMEGLTWDDISGLGGAGSSNAQLSVTQNGGVFAFAPVTINGITYTGGGNVLSTSTISGYFEWVDPRTEQNVWAQFFSRDINGSSITLQIEMIQDGPGGDAECPLNPFLDLDVTVS